jgi:hypothetical protein
MAFTTSKYLINMFWDKQRVKYVACMPELPLYTESDTSFDLAYAALKTAYETFETNKPDMPPVRNNTTEQLIIPKNNDISAEPPL